MRFRHATLLLTLAGLLLSACATVPITGRKALILIPDAQMEQLGVEAYAEMKRTNTISKDRQKTEMVERIGRRIAKASGQKFNWEFVLFDDPKTVNAFCLPGGKVAVYTGILPVAANEAGLAAILGHEVAHAIARHGAERVSQSLLVEAGMSLADLTLGSSEYHDTIMAGLGLGAQYGVMLPYSRDHESEADRMGIEYAAKAGYDPAEGPALWERMAQLGSGDPEFMSTHPDSNRRAKELRKLLPKMNKHYDKSEKQPSTPIR